MKANVHGKRRRRSSRGARRSLSPPQSITEVKELLAGLVVNIRAGKADPKRAIAAAHVATALMKAIQLGDFEQRLNALEQVHQAPSVLGPAVPNLTFKENVNDII